MATKDVLDTELPRSEQLKEKVPLILKKTLGLEVNPASIQYLDRGYNNYLYTVELSENLLPPLHKVGTQPGTVPLPTSGILHSLLVRILKTELGALPERVQNEVAALALAREPLRPVVRLPDVYAWSEGRGADETPFIVLELLPGVPLDTLWPNLALPARVPIISQIADIFLTMRSTPLPVSPDSGNYTFGGLGFSPSGEITTAVHPDSRGGPFRSSADQWISMLSYQLRYAGENQYIMGWKGPLRSRLDSFIADKEHGFQAILQQAATDPIFVHGDFKCGNILVSPETHRVTGLLDFEFSRIATTPEELLDGLEDFRCHTCVEPPPDGQDIHRLEANGWPCENNPSGHAGLGCGTARAWKNLVGPVLPMHGYEATAKISLFLEKLCPWYFHHEAWRRAHDMVVERKIVEDYLGASLSEWGF
ncbi:kinase-like domain-containing protein [Mycena rebaudengoi]|nr:kinase-like domain-containing protein [Mycena rebaudengoi]